LRFGNAGHFGPGCKREWETLAVANIIDWFEIPTTDLNRAVRFYETVLGVALKPDVFGGIRMASFPYTPGLAGGALVQDERRSSSMEGVLVYLDAQGQLDACLQRVAKAGGAILTPKRDIGDPGFVAIVRDTEGNAVGLHQHR
jgi:predicted enzyme related to lactoylglutathione lyase